MEHKDEKKQSPENQDGRRTTPQADNIPATSQQPASADPTSEDTSHIPLQRPWTDREHAIDDFLKKVHLWKAKPDKADALERWSTQPMSDGPYQNMNSVVPKTQTEPPNASDDHLPKQPAPVSDTAATSGSGIEKTGEKE
ncbi:uncharacterized protein F4807DRAFT_464319 [Annulohypoxylon truncatum]|uniref:uncharacterized protein n=1 Tax=Annulohypoxylon truncatum TaxID=327061 RepID=UPI002007418C|nr:uncharacterized protein F4807DRAFT_464319 [Annulohypoxylon truncatum]KAI1205857.1 hypothetical protein F4807DRAFT_464319 [Annulohypoxylon truncatum]